jgi:hypothetical protein
MNQNKNVLSENRYLISTELQEVLSTSRSLYDSTRPMTKDTKGVYFVLFRSLNRKTNVLVYNYLFYPYAFNDALLIFLCGKIDFQNTLVYSE